MDSLTGFEEDDYFFNSYDALAADEGSAAVHSLVPLELEAAEDPPSPEQLAHAARFRRPVATIVGALGLLACFAVMKQYRASTAPVADANPRDTSLASAELEPNGTQTLERESNTVRPPAPEPLIPSTDALEPSSTSVPATAGSAESSAHAAPASAPEASGASASPAPEAVRPAALASSSAPSPKLKQPPAPAAAVGAPARELVRPAISTAKRAVSVDFSSLTNPPSSLTSVARSVARFPDLAH